MRVPVIKAPDWLSKASQCVETRPLSPSEEDSVTAVAYSWLGAFAPILISWLILAFAGRELDLGEFSKNGDFFIIADGLVLPSLLLLVKNKQLETTGTSVWLMIGIILIIAASTSYGVVKLLGIANLPTLQPRKRVVDDFSAVLLLLSLYYAFRLQRVDDERASNLARKLQADEEEKLADKAAETVIVVQAEAAEGSVMLQRDFDQLVQDDELNH